LKFHKYAALFWESPHICWGKRKGRLLNWIHQRKTATGENDDGRGIAERQIKRPGLSEKYKDKVMDW